MSGLLAGIDLGKMGKLAARPVGEVAERVYEGTELFTGALQDLGYVEVHELPNDVAFGGDLEDAAGGA